MIFFLLISPQAIELTDTWRKYGGDEMKFTPTKKEDWLQSIKLNEEYKQFNDGQLSAIYEKMVEEAIKGMISAAALGGKWEPGEPDYSQLEAIMK